MGAVDEGQSRRLAPSRLSLPVGNDLVSTVQPTSHTTYIGITNTEGSAGPGTSYN